ncbi:MAG: hypothetical protein GY733_03630, partial [bacterium]|nr:hypothetical protein [bacterium]
VGTSGDALGRRQHTVGQPAVASDLDAVTHGGGQALDTTDRRALAVILS